MTICIVLTRHIAWDVAGKLDHFPRGLLCNKILLFGKTFNTGSVICPLKTSIISKTAWTSFKPSFSLPFATYRMGKKWPSRVIENVTVIVRLSVDPSIGTFFYLFATIVLLETGMYFDGVWSKLRTKDRIIFLTMLCK